MKIKDLKKLMVSNDIDEVYLVDLYSKGDNTKDKKYHSFKEFRDDEENNEFELISQEALEINVYNGKLIADIFIDTREN